MKNNTFRNEHFEGLIAYHTENKTAPVGYAINRAISAYFETTEKGLDTYTVRETPFEQDMGEFMYLVEDEAGISEFNLCVESSGLMGSLLYLLNTGWIVDGTYEQEIDHFTTFRGLRMKKEVAPK